MGAVVAALTLDASMTGAEAVESADAVAIRVHALVLRKG